MAIQFTDTQRQAIVDKGKNILVSASAGSGKTRVLVERVLQRLLDGEDINRFLIVTFTEAAAAEMRERLEKAIQAEINKQTTLAKQQHLLKQLRLLKIANISTLHAFALRLIEQYHYAIDLDPVFRLIADDAEKQLLMLAVFQDLIEEKYASGDASFNNLARQFVSNGGRDDALRQNVFKLFDFAMARPDTDDWLQSLVNAYEIGDEYTASVFYQQQMQRNLQVRIEGLLKRAEQLVNTINDQPVRQEDVQTTVEQLEWLLAQLKSTTSWDSLRQAARGYVWTAWTKKGLSKPRGLDELEAQEWEQVKETRKAIKEDYENLLQDYFAYDNQTLRVAIAGAREVVAGLVQLVRDFREAYFAEKTRRRTYDFNDLEHFALAIVSNAEIAANLREHYVEIMVDEYQDTNYLQEYILQAIARDNNVFQVGDIKQSIYKFRQAEPKLFGDKLTDTYPNDAQSEVITLAENFRSQANVTNFINYLFMQLMSQNLGDVEYTGDAKLVAGADYYPTDIPHEAELLIYLNDGVNDDQDDDEEPSEFIVTDGFTPRTGQLTLMAHKIQTMLAEGFEIYDREEQVKRAIRYSDIAILVPSRNLNLDLVDVFKQFNLPVTINGSANYFQTTEIAIILALLQVVDNPHQDISLVAVLRSPIYGIRENGLALVRAQHQKGDFYDAVQAFANNQLTIAIDGVSTELVETTKDAVKRFLLDLQQFRETAVQNQIVTLLWQIYDTTGWLDYVGGLPSGAQRQANLHALYERAAAYQASSFVGLYQFINYVNELQAVDKDLSEADANLATDTIQVMTIHGSKGLEFPVVFLLNATNQFNTRDLNGKMILDSQAGVGVEYVDTDHNLALQAPQVTAVRDAIKRAMYAEAFRVLYVALTRAEQQLYLVGTYKNVAEIAKKWGLASQSSADWILDESIRLQAKSYMDLVGMAMVRHPQFSNMAQSLAQYGEFDFGDVPVKAPATYQKKDYATGNIGNLSGEFDFDIQVANGAELAELVANSAPANPEQPLQPTTTPTDIDVDATRDWQQILAFNYQYEMATRATAYQSVSEIKRLFEDPDLAVGRDVVDLRMAVGDSQGMRYTKPEFAVPAFMQAQHARPTATAIGTGVHLVMQRLSLKDGAPTTADVLALIEELTTSQLLDPPVAMMVRNQAASLAEFFSHSELGRAMVTNAATLQREVPFSMLMQAEQLYKGFIGDERVLIHGIIDGYFEVDGGIWLFDYKTDYAKTTADLEKIKERYAGQINVYAQALTAMGKNVVRKSIYSFSAKKIINL